MILIVIIGVVIVLGIFNPYTGLFGNTYYSPKKEEKAEETKEPTHRSFRLTKAD